MNIYVIYCLNLSIYIAGVIAVIRFRKISTIYYPFIFCLWIGGLNETLSVYLALKGYYTLVNNNIYVLIEALLITGFFRKIELLKSGKSFFAAEALIILAWIAENVVWGHITVYSTYFMIFYSFVIVLMSVSAISELVLKPGSNLLQNATFIICISFVLYYTYNVLIHSFLIYGLLKSMTFIRNVYNIRTFINVLTNLLYAMAVLWMPRRFNFLPLF